MATEAVSRPVGSLRERNKARTRAELVEVSQRLFLAQGFAATTLEQICSEVGVSQQTLLRYFDSKQRLALAPEIEALERFSADLNDTHRTVGTLALWRRHIQQGATPAQPEWMVAYYRLIAGEPSLEAMERRILWQYEELIAASFAREAGVDPDHDLLGGLLAATLVAGNAREIRRWIHAGHPDNLPERLLSVIDFVVANFPPRT